MHRPALLTAALFIIAACAHSAPPAPARPPATFDFTPAAGSSAIVIYRNVAGFMGAGGGVNTAVTVDGKTLGDLAQDKYAVIEVTPAEHTVNFQGATGVSNVLVTLAAGEVRFFQVQTYPTLSNVPREQPSAISDLQNEGEPLALGFKYSFTHAPAAVPPADTTRL